MFMRFLELLAYLFQRHNALVLQRRTMTLLTRTRKQVGHDLLICTRYKRNQTSVQLKHWVYVLGLHRGHL
jgi:hypothetical protein